MKLDFSLDHTSVFMALYLWLCIYGYVFMAMYVWLCIYGYVSMTMYVWLCMHAWLRIYGYVCMAMYVLLYVLLCMYAYLHVCITSLSHRITLNKSHKKTKLITPYNLKSHHITYHDTECISFTLNTSLTPHSNNPT